MKYSKNELEALPDTLSSEDVRRVCHVNKRTVSYYLNSGLLPCRYNGKKSHCYFIRKVDLILMLIDYDKNPEKYAVPKPKQNVRYTHLRLSKIELSSKAVTNYYKGWLASQPDILTVTQISQITGYGKKTVTTWTRTNQIKHFRVGNTLRIAKSHLIEFLASESYNDIRSKSQIHLECIDKIYHIIHSDE